MSKITQPFWVASLLIIAMLASGCQLRGADPAPMTTFEPSGDGGAPAVDAGTTDDGQPADGGQQPADGGEQPADGGADSGGIIEPTDTGPIDVFGTQTAEAGTTDTGEMPADDGGEILPPEDGGEEPADGGEQPADGGEQPADGGEEPADGGEQPADGGEQPADPTAVPTPTLVPDDGGQQAGSCSYVVQPGDNLFRIAFNNGLTTEELAAANGITNPENLQPGTVLVLPIEGCEPGDTAGGDVSGQTYTVQAGDTLYRIALRFGVTVEALAQANGITDPSSISIGDVLTIP